MPSLNLFNHIALFSESRRSSRSFLSSNAASRQLALLQELALLQAENRRLARRIIELEATALLLSRSQPKTGITLPNDQEALERYAFIVEMAHGHVEGETDQVVAAFPKVEGAFESTSACFVASVDAARAK